MDKIRRILQANLENRAGQNCHAQIYLLRTYPTPTTHSHNTHKYLHTSGTLVHCTCTQQSQALTHVWCTRALHSHALTHTWCTHVLHSFTALLHCTHVPLEGEHLSPDHSDRVQVGVAGVRVREPVPSVVARPVGRVDGRRALPRRRRRGRRRRRRRRRLPDARRAWGREEGRRVDICDEGGLKSHPIAL